MSIRTFCLTMERVKELRARPTELNTITMQPIN